MKYSDIDIVELNCILRAFKYNVRQRSIWSMILIILSKITNAIIKGPYCNKELKSEILFFESSLNCRRALEPVWRNLDNSIYAVMNKECLSRITIAFYSLLYIPTFFIIYRKQTSDNRLMMRYFFDNYLFSYGMLKVFDDYFRLHKIKLLVVANDHSTLIRCALHIAKIYDIPTLYLQHCSVTEEFPPLNFTYSFLDGEETLLKYKAVGKLSGRIYLSGNPRFDVLSYVKKQESDIIGIALNKADNLIKVKHLCEFLIKNKKSVCVRPHPTIPIHTFDWCKEKNIELSDPYKESSFDFISRIKLLIAGESGIHLDAALMFTPSVYFDMLEVGVTYDWYGYIKNGLIAVAKTQDVLLDVIEKSTNNMKRLQDKVEWYNASTGKAVNGRIGEMIANFIYCYVNDTIDSFDVKYQFVENNDPVTIMKYHN